MDNYPAGNTEIYPEEPENNKRKEILGDEIAEGNKLIAEFMGIEIVESPWPKYKEISGQRLWTLDPHNNYFKIPIIYHSSWDWLLPVVKKIIDLKMEAFKDYDLLTGKYISGRLAPILNELQNIDINNTWYCVVQFIKWFNNTQTKKK